MSAGAEKVGSDAQPEGETNLSTDKSVVDIETSSTVYDSDSMEACHEKDVTETAHSHEATKHEASDRAQRILKRSVEREKQAHIIRLCSDIVKIIVEQSESIDIFTEQAASLSI